MGEGSETDMDNCNALEYLGPRLKNSKCKQGTGNHEVNLVLYFVDWTWLC